MKIFRLKKGVTVKEMLQDPQGQREFHERINKFLREGYYADDNTPICREVVAKEMMSPNDSKSLAFDNKKRITVDHDIDPVDTQYLQIFGVVQSDSEGEYYDDLTGAIKFKQIKPGQRAEFGTVSENEVFLPNLQWGAAFGFRKVWLEDNKLWKIEEVIAEAKWSAYDTKAQFMYDLLRNANFNTTAYSTSWIKSLNAAFARLRRAKDSNGRLIWTGNQKPFILAPPEVQADIEQAVKDSGIVSERGERLTITPNRIYTNYLPATDKKVYVGIPGRRNFVLQERRGLTMDEDKDILAFAEMKAWDFRMNAMVRRTQACEVITFS